MVYNTLHVYKPTVQLAVASHSLFFDIQVVTLLLVENTLFVRANLYYPTTRLPSYFSTSIHTSYCFYLLLTWNSNFKVVLNIQIFCFYVSATKSLYLGKSFKIINFML